MNRHPERPQSGRSSQRRRPTANRQTPVDIWRRAEPLPELEPIHLADDVGALVRSLGDPPLHGAVAAGHYFEIVVQRAAAIAHALALSADLIAGDDE